MQRRRERLRCRRRRLFQNSSNDALRPPDALSTEIKRTRWQSLAPHGAGREQRDTDDRYGRPKRCGIPLSPQGHVRCVRGEELSKYGRFCEGERPRGALGGYGGPSARQRSLHPPATPRELQALGAAPTSASARPRTCPWCPWGCPGLARRNCGGAMGWFGRTPHFATAHTPSERRWPWQGTASGCPEVDGGRLRLPTTHPGRDDPARIVVGGRRCIHGK